MDYTTQKIIEILEKKGFTVEEPEGNGVLHCTAPGYKEIRMKLGGERHLFKVMTKYTTKVKKALEWAGVDKLEDVA